MRWLTLLTALPPKPTRHRVGVWRKLQRMGAVRLRGAGWILPETPETTELFQWLVQEIQSFRGEATLLRVDRVETMTDDEIAALFHKVRNPEYQAVVHRCREILSQLDRYRASHRGSVAALRAKLDGLKRELDRIQSIDYLEAPAGQRARTLWETTAKRLRAAETRPRATGGSHTGRSRPARARHGHLRRSPRGLEAEDDVAVFATLVKEPDAGGEDVESDDDTTRPVQGGAGSARHVWPDAGSARPRGRDGDQGA